MNKFADTDIVTLHCFIICFFYNNLKVCLDEFNPQTYNDSFINEYLWNITYSNGQFGAIYQHNYYTMG